MRGVYFGGLVTLVTSMALVTGVGCNGSKPTGTAPPATSSGTTERTEGGDLKPVAATGRGVLKGKVVLDGTPDEVAKLVAKLNEDLAKAIEDNKDKDHCRKGSEQEKTQQKWQVKDGGLANVFVWVQPPKGQFFKLEKADLDAVAKEVVLDQPHCAFIPHAFTHFPTYYDGDSKAQKKTGQVVKVKNSAPVTHNTSWGGPPRNRGDNKNLGPNTDITISDLKASDVPVTFQCNVHPWMRAYSRVSDHPFVAVSKKDGTFEIKDVPAGAEVSVMYWHESMDAPMELKKVKLMAGDNTEEIKVGAK